LKVGSTIATSGAATTACIAIAGFLTSITAFDPLAAGAIETGKTAHSACSVDDRRAACNNGQPSRYPQSIGTRGFMDRLTIWLRLRNAEIKFRIREVARRWLRKLIELAITDLDLMGRMRDVTTSAAFEAEHLKDAAAFKQRIQLHSWIVRNVPLTGKLFLEFGVYKADSINRFADLMPDATWYGFDSFVGLPEAWNLGAKTGAFSRSGVLPPVYGNVKLIKGFFEQTLPQFVAAHRDETIAILHIDCDLYSATKTVLSLTRPLLKHGTIIIFDELINYQGWQDGEYKALMEFAADQKLRFEYLAYTRTGSQVAIKVVGFGDAAAPEDRAGR
jgi:hypothetical protein